MSELQIPARARAAARFLDRCPDGISLFASILLGGLARIPLPLFFSRFAVRCYASYFGVDLSDVDPESLGRGFRTFDRFFTRPLRVGARPLAEGDGILIAPCDGRLRCCDRIEDGTQIVAKGHKFSVGELLGDEEEAKGFVGGLQATIYLHPRDYHRVHTPCAGTPELLRLIPGRLLPVTDAACEVDPGLFAHNERMVHILNTAYGKVAVVMVAAFGVGNMSCSYQDAPAHPRQVKSYRPAEGPSPAPQVEHGGELGMFHLGSTVILLVESGVELHSGIQMGQMLRFGQVLFQGEVK